MKKYLHQFFFGTNLNNNPLLNTGWLLFRLHIGLSMAIHAGFPKMKDLAAPGWFADQVGGLGFTFPSPAFWAAAASWGEFVGGILIALGLFTRFAALQLAFQFFVVSFLWYDQPEPLTGMYFQQLLFWGYVLVTIAGGGRYSIDALIRNRRAVKANSFSKAAVTCLFVFIAACSHGQKGPLTGSGKLINKIFDYKDFDKLQFEDLDGKVEVQAGKTFSIQIAIDDNLEKLLNVSNENGKLNIGLQGNRNNKLYIENSHINIVITMPILSEIQHRGNDDLLVNAITGNYFRLDHSGNGEVYLNGAIDEMMLQKSGNGDVNAADLLAKKVTVFSSGNGDVTVHASGFFKATGSGNGDIKNTGKALAAEGSAKSGNGEIIDAAYKPTTNPYPGYENKPKVATRILNKTFETVKLKVVYPVKGRYGISIKPGDIRKEVYPLGTKIYKQGAMQQPIFEITPDNQKELLVIE